MQKQSQAVVEITKSILGERFVPGQDVKSYATKSDRQAIAAKIAELMLDGQVALSDEAKAKYGESAETLAKRYVMGMVTNWFNKSPELNGGVKYETKNPGSRAGSSDEEVRELRKLRKHLESIGNADGVTKVDEAIVNRLTAIGAAKSPSVPSIRSELIPADLSDLIP